MAVTLAVGLKVTTATASGTVESISRHPVSRAVTAVIVKTGPGDDDRIVTIPGKIRAATR